MGPGQSFPPLPILSWRRGLPPGSAGRAAGGMGGALDVQTPHRSQAPTSQHYGEQWGRRDGESLHRREGNGQIRRGEAGRKATEGERGGGARGPTCSGVCWQGGNGVPRRTGEALSARFRIPLASGLVCCKRHGFPLGPKAHGQPSASPPSDTGPGWVSGYQAARGADGGGTRREKGRGLGHGLGQEQPRLKCTARGWLPRRTRLEK